MKQLRVLLLPPGVGLPPAECRRYPSEHLGGERQRGVKFLVQENNTIAGNKPPTLISDVQQANYYTVPLYGPPLLTVEDHKGREVTGILYKIIGN